MVTPVPLRAVIFDWDGTLLDSYSADTSAYLQMFRAMGIRWGIADLERHYSPDWYNVYRAADLPMDRWREADRLWRHFYRSERPRLRPGARDVIEYLRNRYRLALVTSGSGTRVRGQLRSFGLLGFFEASVYAEEVPRRKPHPAPLQLALRRLGCEPAACVYVGDAPQDVRMARAAGVFAIGVLKYSPVPERLRAARPDALIPTIAALPKLLGKSNR
jgi:HAD superfamily hydrolase (TIGR01549 family)